MDNKKLKEILPDIRLLGVSRKLDDLGRIVIPMSFRKNGNIHPGTIVSIEFINDCVLLKKIEKNEFEFSRKIDSLGRIVIPIEFRKLWSWNENDLINICVYYDYIILRKINKKCIFCYSEKNLFQYEGKFICQSCKQKILKAWLLGN